MPSENDNGKNFHLTLNAVDRQRLRFLRGIFEKAHGREMSMTAAIRAAVQHLADQAGFSTHEKEIS